MSEILTKSSNIEASTTERPSSDVGCDASDVNCDAGEPDCDVTGTSRDLKYQVSLLGLSYIDLWLKLASEDTEDCIARLSSSLGLI